jgi:hypothetical protein
MSVVEKQFAEAIKGAELVVIEGVGHNLPRPLWSKIALPIASLVQGVESGSTA